MTKPKYITELEGRFEQMEDRQRELRLTWDKYLERQAGELSKLNDIHTLLCGSELDQSNGGYIGRINRMEKEVRKNTTWRVKITAAVSAVAAALGFIVVKFSVIIDNIKNLIHGK